jgi:hypothetical protein
MCVGLFELTAWRTLDWQFMSSNYVHIYIALPSSACPDEDVTPWQQNPKVQRRRYHGPTPFTCTSHPRVRSNQMQSFDLLEYGRRLGCSAVSSGRSLSMFRICLLPPSSERSPEVSRQLATVRTWNLTPIFFSVVQEDVSTCYGTKVKSEADPHPCNRKYIKS